MVLFVAADPREYAGWVSRWDSVHPASLAVNWARTGRWRGRDVMAIANGAGADRAFAAILVAPRPTAVWNIGFCGALDDALRFGDIFIALGVRDGIGDAALVYETLLPDAGVKNGAASGLLLSIDHIAATAAEKRSLRATGASVVEMEAAGVARAAEDLGLPFYCVRVVSDLADENFANDFNAALGADGRFSPFALVKGALADPRKRFGELLRLRQRAALASKKLGDYLAECTIR